MKKIKRILLAFFSIFGLSVATWLVLFLNPSLSYANQTNIGQIRVHHNQPLDASWEKIINDSYEIVRKSELFDESHKIDLCLNENSIYPELLPMKNGAAYTILNKVSIYASTPFPQKNYTEYSWAVHDYETRRWDLTEVIAHEFAHALQYKDKMTHAIKYPSWKLEGYAEYIGRDGRSSFEENMEKVIEARENEYVFNHWFLYEDGTGAVYYYLRYWTMMQYMMEVKKMTYKEVLNNTLTEEEVLIEMIQWFQEN